MLGFLVPLVTIGIRASKHIRNQEDFFLAGRRLHRTDLADRESGGDERDGGRDV